MDCPYKKPKDGYHCREGQFYERAFENQKPDEWNHMGECPHCKSFGPRVTGQHNPFNLEIRDPKFVVDDNYGPKLKKIPLPLSEAIDDAVNRALGEDHRILRARGLTRAQHIAREVKKAMVDYSKNNS